MINAKGLQSHQRNIIFTFITSVAYIHRCIVSYHHSQQKSDLEKLVLIISIMPPTPSYLKLSSLKCDYDFEEESKVPSSSMGMSAPRKNSVISMDQKERRNSIISISDAEIECLNDLNLRSDYRAAVDCLRQCDGLITELEAKLVVQHKVSTRGFCFCETRDHIC